MPSLVSVTLTSDSSAKEKSRRGLKTAPDAEPEAGVLGSKPSMGLVPPPWIEQGTS